MTSYEVFYTNLDLHCDSTASSRLLDNPEEHDWRSDLISSTRFVMSVLNSVNSSVALATSAWVEV